MGNPHAGLLRQIGHVRLLMPNDELPSSCVNSIPPRFAHILIKEVGPIGSSFQPKGWAWGPMVGNHPEWL